MVNSWKPLIVSAKSSILIVRLGSEYVFENPLFLCILVEEKETYLDLLDDDFGSLIKQIEKFDELQIDILTQIDPQLLTKSDLVRANIEVCSRNFIYSWIKNMRLSALCQVCFSRDVSSSLAQDVFNNTYLWASY